MLGSDDRDEELDADEALWERLRARATGEPAQPAAESVLGAHYGEQSMASFDRHDASIAEAFREEDEDYEPSAVVGDGEYEFAGDARGEFGGAAAHHELEADADEDDEEALWAQARASRHFSPNDEEAQHAGYAGDYAYEPDDGQRYSFEQVHGEAGYADESAFDGYEEPQRNSLIDASSFEQQGHAQQGYTPQGYAPQGYAPQGYAPQGYPDAASSQAFHDPSYSQAASTGFPPASSGFNQQQWAANFEVPEAASAPKKRSGRWGVRLLAVTAVLAGAAGASYQFILLPQQQRERAQQLAALEAQQQKVMEEERLAKEAAARAEEERRAASEAALKRAEEAAAAAVGGVDGEQASAPEAEKPGKSGKVASAGESAKERKARKRAEAKAAKAAARAAKRERSDARLAKASASESDSRPKKRSKRAESDGDGADNNDPLFGL